jgi:hypothetical protein
MALKNAPMLWCCIIAITLERLRAIDPLMHGEKHIRMLRGSPPIDMMCRRGIRGWLERVYDPQNAPMLCPCIIAIIKERFEGHRPSHPR